MNDPFVKICGITRVEDAIFSVENGAAIIGVVRSSRSPRRGSAALINELSDMGMKVAAVYTEMDTIRGSSSLEAYVQLHFSHGNDEIAYVKEELGLKAISVIFANSEDSPLGAALDKINQGADLVLLEYGREGWSSRYRKIPDIEKHPIGIAGRVSVGNLRELLKESPYFIDVSSSLEDSPGKKNHSKIRDFMEVLKTEKSAV